jgi:hypothetical protein
MNAVNKDPKALFEIFSSITIFELEKRLSESDDREEKIFLRELINLKLQLAQEKVVGEMLL